MSRSLGCGRYLVRIQERGGGSPIVAPVTSGTWERAIDKTSDASLVLPYACCDMLAGVDPWAHEIAILRSVNGANHRGVWLGPITEIERDPDAKRIAIRAQDLTAWWPVRLIQSDFDRTTETGSGPERLIDQAIDLSNDAMAPDPLPGLVMVDTTPGSLLSGERKVLAAEHRDAMSPISEIARDAIDFTAHATAENMRVVLVGEPQIYDGSPPVATLNRSHFARAPRVRSLAPVTRVIVAGSGGGASGDELVGIAEASAAAIAKFGAVARRWEEPRIEDQPSAQAAAEYRLSLLGPDASLRAPRRIEGGVLVASAPIDIDDLYGGARFWLAFDDGCANADGLYIASGLHVEFGNGSESVAPAFTPAADFGAAA